MVLKELKSPFRAMPDAREGNAAATAKPTVKDFLFGKVIGEGSFSTVYLTKELKSGEEYASKSSEIHIPVRCLISATILPVL